MNAKLQSLPSWLRIENTVSRSGERGDLTQSLRSWLRMSGSECVKAALEVLRQEG